MGVAVFQYNFIAKNVQLLTKMEGWIWTCDPSPSQLMWMLLACGLYFLWWCLGSFGQPEDPKKILEKLCPHRGSIRHLQGSGPFQVRRTRVIYYYHKGPGGDTVKMESLWIFSNKGIGEGNGNPLQYSYLGNPMDRGAWWATVHGVTKSWARQNDLATNHTLTKSHTMELWFHTNHSMHGVLGGCFLISLCLYFPLSLSFFTF